MSVCVLLSSPHRANILCSYNSIGAIGVTSDRIYFLLPARAKDLQGCQISRVIPNGP
jgi:hypothetical protein